MVSLYFFLEIHNCVFIILPGTIFDSINLVYWSTTGLCLGISGSDEFICSLWYNYWLFLFWTCWYMYDSLFGICINWLELDELLRHFCFDCSTLLNDCPKISLFNWYDFRNNYCLLVIHPRRKIFISRRLVHFWNPTLQTY